MRLISGRHSLRAFPMLQRGSVCTTKTP